MLQGRSALTARFVRAILLFPVAVTSASSLVDGQPGLHRNSLCSILPCATSFAPSMRLPLRHAAKRESRSSCPGMPHEVVLRTNLSRRRPSVVQCMLEPTAHSESDIASVERKKELQTSSSPADQNTRQPQLKRLETWGFEPDGSDASQGVEPTEDTHGMGRWTASPLTGSQHGTKSVLSLSVLEVDGGVQVVSGGHDDLVRLWAIQESPPIEIANELHPQAPLVVSAGSLPPGPSPITRTFSLAAAAAADHDPSQPARGWLFAGGGTERCVTAWAYRVEDSGANRAENKSTLRFESMASLPGHTGWVRSLAVDQNILYSVGCNYIKVWQLPPLSPVSEEGQAEVRLLGDLEVRGDILCVDAAGGVVCCGGIDGTIRVWNAQWQAGRAECIATAKPTILRGHDGRVTAMEIRDGRLHTCGHDGFVRVWQLDENEGDEQSAEEEDGWHREEEEGAVLEEGAGDCGRARLRLVGETDVGKMLSYCGEDGRLLCMALSPDDTGGPIEGNMNSCSGRYLYLGTSGGSLVVVDREPLPDGELRVCQITPEFTTDRGEGKVTSLACVRWTGKQNKALVVGFSTGVLDTYLPAI